MGAGRRRGWCCRYFLRGRKDLSLSPPFFPPTSHPPTFLCCSKIEARTRQILTGKDINDLYDSGVVVSESVAEGEGVERIKVDE